MTTAFTDLEALWHEHQFALLRHARAHVGVQAAEDVVQDVFCNALKALLKDDTPIRTPRAWLFRILHNRIIDYYRANGRQPQWVALDELLGDEDDAPGKTEAERLATAVLTPHELMEQRDAAKQLHAAIGGLAERQAYALNMRLAGWETGEVAARLGIQHDAAKQLHTRAFRTLRARLQEAG
jgi:RNA polymerase sigma factor (sigma-70 family)